MYFAPIILAPFPSFFFSDPLPAFTIPQPEPNPQLHQKKYSLHSAVQNFLKIIPQLRTVSDLPISTTYMNLNLKFSQIQLPSADNFIQFYNSVVNKYKTTYANTKIKHSWSRQDVVILLWIINWLYQTTLLDPLEFSKQNWMQVASVIPFRSGQDCMYKWLAIRNNQLEDSPWTPEEKNLLHNIMESMEEIDWIHVSKELHRKLPQHYRTPKQCKESWSIISSQRYQRSKKFWSFQQDNQLIEAFSEYGRKWKQIAQIIKGRSQNAIKNRFTLLSQKYCKKQTISRNDKELVKYIKRGLAEDLKESLACY